MLYSVLFEDNVTRAEAIRREFLPDHLVFLERNRGRIIAAGPLRDASDAPAGGMWLVRAETPDVVEELVRADPFWPTGLRRSHRVLQWQRVFGADVFAA
ncbi:YciI family protein [Dongia rigui]|uniref:YciI family protein n=1 Tax=Dongia rigui TaxID=940149 RepID=A0ABU5DYB5_9PROT|nr:YciI family protein [Dongia rigui]MDY0872331.1 YciI family protein [Dongia rigui]